MTYPGQGTPSPVIGQANHVPSPVAPVVASSTHQPQYTPPPVVATAVYTAPAPTRQEVGQRVKNPNPYNNQVPIVAQGIHTPLNTPLGVYPAKETSTQEWTWDYGNGGGQGNY